MTGTIEAPRRSTRAHVLVVLLVVLGLLTGLAVTVYSLVDLYPACVADFSEDTIVAPDSYRGMLLCGVSDGELTDSNLVVFAPMAAQVLLAVLALVVWARRRRYAVPAALLVAALAVPLLVRGLVEALPADCTQAQWDAHGARGCERDEEVRPGLGRY